MTLVIVKYLLLPAAGACVAWFVAQRLDVGRWELRLAGRARRLVSGLTVLVAGVFATLLVARYLTWHSFILDLGSYDQKVWLIATRPDLGAMLEQTYRGGVRVMPCGSMRYWGICHFQPLYLLYDQVYWMLTFGSARHEIPVRALPEVARYTVLVDGISKAFAATGVRVGWCIGPRAVIAAIRDILGHVGAWAPRAEQVATAELLRDHAAMDAYLREHKGRLQQRLDRLHEGFSRMTASGLLVRDIPPQGAIYLSVQFDLIGKRGFRTNDQVRKYLLEEAGFAVVPFQAFGLSGENGWFRLSVGAVSMRDIDAALPRVEAALRKAVG